MKNRKWLYAFGGFVIGFICGCSSLIVLAVIISGSQQRAASPALTFTATPGAVSTSGATETPLASATFTPVPIPTWTSTPWPTATPTDTPTAAPTETPLATSTSIATRSERPSPTSSRAPTAVAPVAVIKADALNIRAGPGIEYDGVGQLFAGDEVEIIARNEDADWIQIAKPDGVKGWISAWPEYVGIAIDLASVHVASDIPAAPTSTLAPATEEVPVTPTLSPTPTQVVVPTPVPQHPAGATALCCDGSYSYSAHRRGTCSHHGGVCQWLKQVPP